MFVLRNIFFNEKLQKVETLNLKKTIYRFGPPREPAYIERLLGALRTNRPAPPKQNISMSLGEKGNMELELEKILVLESQMTIYSKVT